MSQKQTFQQGSLRLLERTTKPAVWVFRYRENGKRKAIQVGTIEKYPTEAKAQKALFATRVEINEKTECIKFSQLAERYKAEEMPDRHSTKTPYRSVMKRLQARWDAERIEDMARNTIAIELWLKTLETEDGEPLAKKTKQNIRALLHLVFERAMQWNYLALQRNPIDLVRVLGKDTKKRPRTRLSVDQIQVLLMDPKLPTVVKVMVMVAICTGMRASEILGLKWSVIDFDKGAISVEVSFVGKHADEPKTDDSQAEVPMHEDLATVLSAWKKVHPPVNDWVFANPITKRPYWRDSLQKDHLKPAGERLKIPDLGWHSFRHTYRAMLKDLGLPLEVQKNLMRHSDISMTIEYGKESNVEALRPANATLVAMLPVKVLVPGAAS